MYTTYSQWEALTPEEKSQYETVNIIDEFNRYPIDSIIAENSSHKTSDESSIKGELMAAITTIEVSCGITSGNYNMSSTKNSIASGDYKSASTELTKVFNIYITPDNTEAIKAYKTASRCLGQLI